MIPAQKSRQLGLGREEKQGFAFFLNKAKNSDATAPRSAAARFSRLNVIFGFRWDGSGLLIQKGRSHYIKANQCDQTVMKVETY